MINTYNQQLFHWSTVTFSSQRSHLEQINLHPGLVEPGDHRVHIHWGVLGQDIIPGWGEEETEQKDAFKIFLHLEFSLGPPVTIFSLENN